MAMINLFSNAKFWRLGAIALHIFTLPIPAMAQSEDNRDSVPYRLLVPLLQPLPLPGEAAQLQVGAELPALPIDLPTPQAGVLQWSLINRPQYFTLVFEVPQGRSQSEATYLEQLQASGWRPWSIEQLYPESSLPSDEFDTQPSSAQPNDVERSAPIVLESHIVLESRIGSQEPQIEPLVFCNQDSDARITLGLFQTAPDRTKLQIDLTVEQSDSICNLQSSSFSEPFPELALPPPTDAQIDLIDGGSSINYAVNIQIPLSLEALADHYAAQMRQQGWNLQTSGGNDLLQWSVWSRTDSPDSPQQATVYLFATEKSNQYIGAFRAPRRPWQTSLLAFPTFAVQPGELPKATALQILRDRWGPYQLWLEQLPPLLSDEITIPSETTLLGGASAADTGTAILETSLHPQTIRTFYREFLTTAGWLVYERVSPSDGFAFEASASYPYSLYDVFCQPDEGAEILLSALPRPNGLTTIRLMLHPSREFSPCQVDREAYGSNRDFWANIPLPNLQIPPETTVLLDSSDSRRNYISSAIHLQTQLTVQDLANHYAEQMRQAGWTQRTVNHSDGASVSLWRIETDTDNLWQGVLSFIAQSEPGYWAGSFIAVSDEQTEQWIPVQ